MAAMAGTGGAGRRPEAGGQRSGGGQGAGRRGGQPRSGGQRPGGGEGAGRQGAPGGRPGMGGMGAARSGGIDDIFERLPVISVTDITVGEMIAVSSSKTNNAENIRAIKLIAGIEPFVTAAQMAGGAGRRMGRGGQDTGFMIPGLDGGIDF